MGEPLRPHGPFHPHHPPRCHGFHRPHRPHHPHPPHPHHPPRPHHPHHPHHLHRPHHPHHPHHGPPWFRHHRHRGLHHPPGTYVQPPEMYLPEPNPLIPEIDPPESHILPPETIPPDSQPLPPDTISPPVCGTPSRKVPKEPGIKDDKTSERRGGFECEFVEQPPDSFPQTDCPVCLCVLCEPYQVTCCGYSFCQGCIDRVKRDSKPCPTCNEKDFADFPNKGLKRSLYTFKVYCIKKADGCVWTGELGQLDNHLNQDH